MTWGTLDANLHTDVVPLGGRSGTRSATSDTRFEVQDHCSSVVRFYPCFLGGVACVFAIVTASSAAEIKLPLETSVKILQPAAAASPPAMPMMVTRRPPPMPTTPGAKYPQYQMGHQHRHNSNSDDAADPRLRFFLSLPQRILLIETTITIDDVPFRMVREKRVEQILKDVVENQSLERPKQPALPANDSNTDVKGDDEGQPTQTTARAVIAKALPTPNMTERLRHTRKVTGEDPTSQEVHWLLSNWVDGPIIMQLNDNFQRFRANQRPGFVVLDRDRDGTVSREELQQAVQSFQECDLNQDGIVQFTEIAAAAADPRIVPLPIPIGHPITLVPDDEISDSAYQRLLAATLADKDGACSIVPRFDPNGNGRFDADELQTIRTGPPDISLAIVFDSANAAKSRIAVTGLAADLTERICQATVDSSEITLRIGEFPVIFSAVQTESADQISLGAVHDGYPLLPAIDPNDDGRLTTRELRSLVSTLKAFDRNGDGALAADEVQAPLRVCFGMGPIVHRELMGIRSIGRKPTANSVTGPEWFTRMDRNKDNDVTRGEFPGTDEQFHVLDADGDELISAEEAIEFDKKAGAAEPNGDSAQATPSSPKANPTESNSTQETKPQ